MPSVLSTDSVNDALSILDGWSGDTSGVERTIDCHDFPSAVRLVNAVAQLAEERNHHPDIDIRWRTVRFALSTHSAGGVTELDVQLAADINRLASELGVERSG